LIGTLRGRSRLSTNSEISMIEDIIVLGGLAVLFGWTYIILPLVFFHG